MSMVKINVSEVMNSGTHIVKAKRNVSSAKQSVSAIKNSVDNRILSRNEIGNEFANTIYKLNSIERSIDRIKSFVESSANEYNKTEQKLKRLSNSVLNAQLNTRKRTANEKRMMAQFRAAKNRGRINIQKFTGSITSACLGSSKAVVTKAKHILSKIKKIYEEKGKAYQYGKAVLSIGKAVIKIAASVAAISSGVGAPIAIVAIISAANEIINASNNIAYIYMEDYDEIEKHNYLKDYLVTSGEYIGTEVLKNEALGRNFGQAVYSGVEIVDFLDSADKMLKSFGKMNTVVTDTAKCSFVWGESDWDDVLNNKIKFKPNVDYFARKLLRVNPSSPGNIIFETAKNAYTAKKEGDKVAKTIIESIN